MKKYILAGIVLLGLSAVASENPFDLKANFGQLEQDEASLLSELRKISELKKSVREKAVTIQEVEAEKETIEIVVKEVSSVMIDDIVTSSDEEELKKVAFENAKKDKEAKIQKAQEEAQRLESTKKEAEKREVEAYEKKRAQRLARKASAAALLEKDSLAEKEAKAKALTQEEKTRKAKKSQEVLEKEVLEKEEVRELKISVNDIDVEKGREEAKVAADKAYEEAVKEMNQER